MEAKEVEAEGGKSLGAVCTRGWDIDGGKVEANFGSEADHERGRWPKKVSHLRKSARESEGKAGASGGRSVPVLSGFLGDRPNKSPTIASSRLRGAAGPMPHHPHRSLRSDPPSSPRRGACFREEEGGDGCPGRSVDACSSWFFGGRTYQKAYDCQFEASMGGQAGASPPHRSLRSESLSTGKKGTCFCEAGRGYGRGEPLVDACSSWFSGGRTCRKAGDRGGFEARRSVEAGASRPHCSLRFGPLSLQGRGKLVSARWAEAMGAGSGRSVPMVRGFLEDRPAKRPQSGVRGLEGRLGPRLTIPALAPLRSPSSRGGGELLSGRRKEAIGWGPGGR